MGWSELSNGALLRAANAQFDVLITTDRSLRHQQNIVGLRLAILVLPTTNWLSIRLHATQIVVAVEGLAAGTLFQLDFT
jgi:hypothetical protein